MRRHNMNTTKVTRVEVIDHTDLADFNARKYVKKDDNIDVEVQLQDDDRTLKIFITPKKDKL